MVSRISLVAAVLSASVFGLGCGQATPCTGPASAGGDCPDIAGSWVLVVDSSSNGGTCTVFSTGGAFTARVSQPGGASKATFLLPVNEFVNNFPIPITLSANGTIYADGADAGTRYTVTALAAQTTETYPQLTILRSDMFSLDFQLSSQCQTSAPGLGAIPAPCFTGSWTTTEQQTAVNVNGNGNSTTSACTLTAFVHGAPVAAP